MEEEGPCGDISCLYAGVSVFWMRGFVDLSRGCTALYVITDTTRSEGSAVAVAMQGIIQITECRCLFTRGSRVAQVLEVGISPWT